jgi:hypothetical protein
LLEEIPELLKKKKIEEKEDYDDVHEAQGHNFDLLFND